MNKTQLVDALTERLGDRRTAASAVDGVLETIVETVKSGESVTLTGFGVFSSRARAARTARNPRTGEAVAVPAATVPAFRPGVGFRTAVGGPTDPPQRARRSTPTPRTTPPRRTAATADGVDAAVATDATTPAHGRKVPPADAPAVNGAAVMSSVKVLTEPAAAPAKAEKVPSGKAEKVPAAKAEKVPSAKEKVPAAKAEKDPAAAKKDAGTKKDDAARKRKKK